MKIVLNHALRAPFGVVNFKNFKNPLVSAPALLAPSLPKDTFTFRGNNADKGDSLSYESFRHALADVGIYDTKELQKNISDKNLLGSGLNSRVYSLNDPKLGGWVIKVDKNSPKEDFEEPLRKTENVFGGENFGQEIAKMGQGVHVLKKIDGMPHSVGDWSSHINNFSTVSEAEAKNFLLNLEEISQFPKESFVFYAKQLKALEDNGFKMDSINPNNLLVDYDKQEIHIIDFFKKADPSHTNTKDDLVVALVDFSLFGNFAKKLDDTQQKRLVECAREIEQKCADASRECGIEESEGTFLNFIANVDKWFGCHLADKGGTYGERYEVYKSLSDI